MSLKLQLLYTIISTILIIIEAERLPVSSSTACTGGDCVGRRVYHITDKIEDLPPLRDGKSTSHSLESETRRSYAPYTAALAPECSLKSHSTCRRAGLSEFSVDSNKKPIKILCRQDRWIVIMQRFDGSVHFHNKTWQAYRDGFGTVSTNAEFFLGLQNLHEITSTGLFELRIDLEDFEGSRRVAQYSEFSVSDEQSVFKLNSLGLYSGDAGDSFSYHEGQGFTTIDRDNDGKQFGNCGEQYSSAGWFKECMKANLMGQYLQAENDKFREGMYWDSFHGPDYALKKVKMSIRAKCGGD